MSDNTTGQETPDKVESNPDEAIPTESADAEKVTTPPDPPRKNWGRGRWLLIKIVCSVCGLINGIIVAVFSIPIGLLAPLWMTPIMVKNSWGSEPKKWKFLIAIPIFFFASVVAGLVMPVVVLIRTILAALYVLFSKPPD